MTLAIVITCTLSVAIFGTALWCITPSNERRWIIFCVLAQLPMSWLMFHLVRMPLDIWLTRTLGAGQLLAWLHTAYAPLTEEPAKLWPLLVPAIAHFVTRQSLGRFALALGLGFALGEVFTVAALVTASRPDVASLPWWQLGGFITERFMTCATHGAMTALALFVWRKTNRFLPGLLLAMLAHYLSNFPITAAHRGWFGTNQQIVQLILLLFIWGYFFCAVAWLVFLNANLRGLGLAIHGRADCPECGAEYARPIFALNFGPRRYEPCPQCRKWHWTTRKLVA